MPLEGRTLQMLWGTTEDLKGQQTADEVVGTSEDSTLQNKPWGTTEDQRGRHTAEAVGSY